MQAPRADSSFCSSAYGVLAAVSICFSPPKGRFLRFTHPSAHKRCDTKVQRCTANGVIDLESSCETFSPGYCCRGQSRRLQLITIVSSKENAAAQETTTMTKKRELEARRSHIPKVIKG
ncbi:hypothetical protein FXO38_22317 [Capsicum annuum]|nr:hypothetical protein FXO38_22317 [Capsicum annuum]